ncbi:hypothetical protein T05_10611 [Trichinella murrelli]|uniref:Uncharacterized protein n=1 Tax=Trichinella murrelli TaxID=144512 RepID=A0A0V0U3K0_9BILA|nr:hypothetical protein T05_10611 [Trichinella murrelli]
MHKNRFPALRYANNDHHKGALSSVQRTEQRKSENTDDIEANHGRHEAEQEKTRALWRRVLTKSMFLLWRFLSHSHINVLIGRIEQCISPVDCGIG